MLGFGKTIDEKEHDKIKGTELMLAQFIGDEINKILKEHFEAINKRLDEQEEVINKIIEVLKPKDENIEDFNQMQRQDANVEEKPEPDIETEIIHIKAEIV
jgi:hypothetical protein